MSELQNQQAKKRKRPKSPGGNVKEAVISKVSQHQVDKSASAAANTGSQKKEKTEQGTKTGGSNKKPKGSGAATEGGSKKKEYTGEGQTAKAKTREVVAAHEASEGGPTKKKNKKKEDGEKGKTKKDVKRKLHIVNRKLMEWAKDKNIEKASEEFYKLQKKGVKLNVHTYTNMINAWYAHACHTYSRSHTYALPL